MRKLVLDDNLAEVTLGRGETLDDTRTEIERWATEQNRIVEVYTSAKRGGVWLETILPKIVKRKDGAFCKDDEHVWSGCNWMSNGVDVDHCNNCRTEKQQSSDGKIKLIQY